MAQPPPPKKALESTVDAADLRDDLVATVAPAGSRDRVAAGAHIGRYVVLEPLGAGGMGVVYKAYDPEIDRAVAVKLLRGQRATGQERMLREAKALGRVAHPNVVAVHDVGAHDGGVFIAMELVSGPNLADWLQAERRTLREILDTLVAAGRGLAAAHAAGVVHRDFKPANAVIGTDGRVRVLDFGLAREERDDGDELGADASASAGNLTVTGAIIGTPRFMAPEQLEGQAADERSDQFSFCVSLWMALYGETPFPGDNVAELAESTRHHTPRAPASSAIDVPAWVRELMLRGLRPDPAERHPSMTSLLDALERDPAQRRRRVLAFAGVAALAGVAAFGLVRGASASDSDKVELCRSADGEVDEVWNPTVRERIARAFAASGSPAADHAIDRVSAALDDYTRRWAGVRTEACEATNLHGTQSAALLDLRMHCLDRRLHEVVTLVDVFGDRPDTTVVNNAVVAVHQLGSLDICSDPDALRSTTPLPEAPTARARIEALWKRVDRQQALLRAGKYEEVLSADPALADEVARSDFAPVQASLNFVRGEAQAKLVHTEHATDSFRRAIAAAARAGDDFIAARSWTWLLFVVGYLQGEPARALEYELAARAAATRADDPFATVWLLTTLAAVVHQNGDAMAGRELLQEAVALVEESRDPDQRVHTLSNLAVNLESTDDLEHARELYQRAADEAREALGPHHPTYGFVLVNLGDVLIALRQHADARARCRDAAELFGNAGADAERARALTCEAEALIGLDTAADALPLLEQAAEIAAATSDPRPMVNARRQFAHARALWLTGGDRARAVDLARQAQAFYRDSPETSPRQLTEVETWLAEPRRAQP